MCQYVKDDGEKCGRDSEPFCHDHEDTRFAALYHLIEERDDGESDEEDTVEGRTCSECGETIQTVVSDLSRMQFQPTMVEVTILLTCGCPLTVELSDGGKRIPDDRIPESWL